MKKKIWSVIVFTLVCVVFAWITPSPPAGAAQGKPILIGVPVSMGVFYGPDVRDGLALAIKEINAAGGVKVGGEMRPFEMIIADTRAMEPGVPITDSLLAIERLITQQKVDFLLGGPVRSEAAFAARPLITQYKKVSMITTGCYSPRYGDAEKYPYCFRIIGDVSFEIPHVHMKLLKHMREKFGSNKMYIIVQDVKHARAAGDIVEKLATKDGFEILGKEIYPTGSTDFSLALLAAKNKGAQILFLWIDMPELTILAKQYYDFKVPALPIGYLGPAEHLEWWPTTEGKGEYFIVDLLRAGLVGVILPDGILCRAEVRGAERRKKLAAEHFPHAGERAQHRRHDIESHLLEPPGRIVQRQRLVLVLVLPAQLDLTNPLSAEWREGELW